MGDGKKSADFDANRGHKELFYLLKRISDDSNRIVVASRDIWDKTKDMDAEDWWWIAGQESRIDINDYEIVKQIDTTGIEPSGDDDEAMLKKLGYVPHEVRWTRDRLYTLAKQIYSDEFVRHVIRVVHEDDDKGFVVFKMWKDPPAKGDAE